VRRQLAAIDFLIAVYSTNAIHKLVSEIKFGVKGKKSCYVTGFNSNFLQSYYRPLFIFEIVSLFQQRRSRFITGTIPADAVPIKDTTIAWRYNPKMIESCLTKYHGLMLTQYKEIEDGQIFERPRKSNVNQHFCFM
jgi:hypothetical protein